MAKEPFYRQLLHGLGVALTIISQIGT